MQRIKFSLVFSILVFLAACPVFAQSTKTITLRDGTQIKGEVTSLQNGIYTIHSPTLGILDIQEADIDSISSDNRILAAPALQQAAPQHAGPAVDQNPLMLQAQQMQGDRKGVLSETKGDPKGALNEMKDQLMDDPAVRERAERMANDPRMQELLTDPSVMQDILSGDPERIQNNPNLQEILEDPEMQSLMGEIQNKMSGQSPERSEGQSPE
ncbi:MAG: hypothetical protein Q7S13_01850 [Candidatus Omnitrophota bacterium]|nr:hypothetical protein [Candidatus Omnitrophota bacterium]